MNSLQYPYGFGTGALGALFGGNNFGTSYSGVSAAQSQNTSQMGMALIRQQQQAQLSPLVLALQQGTGHGIPTKPEKPKLKVIQSVEIRPKQDIKLLRAGEGI